MSVVAITGASAGIGRACSRAFAAAGYDVALLAREPERLAEAAEEIEALGRRSLAIKLDVADADAVERAAGRIEGELGEIDVWVNNVSNSVVGPVLDIAPEEFRRVTEVTYLGAVHGTLSALRRMLPRDRGTIVQVGSGLTYRSIPLQAPYCGAKAAIRGFTDSVRPELLHARSKVRLTAVNLPAMNTPQFSWVRHLMTRAPRPLPPVYQPELAAEAIVWAAEHAPRELNLGWPTVAGRFLNGLAPGLMDRYVAATAWSGQLSEDPASRMRPDNLEAPVKADVAAHGAFGAGASTRSPLLWLAMHGTAVRAGVMAGLVALGAVALRGRAAR